MNTFLDLDTCLDTIAKILIRSFLIGLLILLFWFAVYMCCYDAVYTIHSYMFKITEQQFNLLNYFGMGFLKFCLIIFFLCPYIAIKMHKSMG